MWQSIPHPGAYFFRNFLPSLCSQTVTVPTRSLTMLCGDGRGVFSGSRNKSILFYVPRLRRRPLINKEMSMNTTRIADQWCYGQMLCTGLCGRRKRYAIRGECQELVIYVCAKITHSQSQKNISPFIFRKSGRGQ